MKVLLCVIGAVTMIAAVVIGIMERQGFLILLFTGAAGAVIPFALALVLDNQEKIISRLDYLEKGPSGYSLAASLKEKITCPQCGREYESDYKSCPHCGHR